MKKNFKEMIESGKLILFDGALGTMLYDAGVFFNRCYEEVNLTHPALLENIHEAYVQAGAMVLETNTFGANREKLKAYGLDDKVYEINLAGVNLARKAAGEDLYVAGSIGPIGRDIIADDEKELQVVFDIYREQAEALKNGGVDLFILETFRELESLKQAVKAIRMISKLPIIVSITFTERGETILGLSIEKVVSILNELPVDVIGSNCGIGPKPMLENVQKILQNSKKPVSVMPNAGYPQKVNDRIFYSTSPEYFAEYALRYVQMGARIVGGCCGTTPEHIREAKNMLVIQLKQDASEVKITSEVKPQKNKKGEEIKPFDEIPVPDRSPFGSKLGKKFLISVEMSLPKGSDLTKSIEKIKFLKEHGIDAVNIPDSPRASARMNPMAMSAIIEREVGMETIWHYTCRDKSLIGIQADLLGADALKLHNILAVTGDPPKLGDYPYSTGVFDVDSIGMTKVISNLNRGIDLGGNVLNNPTCFVKGVGANPAAVNFEEEVERTVQKIEAGAEYIMTQPVFDLDAFYRFQKAISQYKISILIGILPLSSFKLAEFFHNEIPGMQVPQEIRNHLKKAQSKEEAREIGMKIAQEILVETHKKVQGCYIMIPLGNQRRAVDLIKVIQ